MRDWIVLILAILSVGCASATPTEEPTQTPSPTATIFPTVEPVDLAFLDKLADDEILIQYSRRAGFVSNYALYFPPRFVLYASGRLIFAKYNDSTVPSSLFEATLSKSQVQTLMMELHSFGKVYLKGYGYDDCPCPTDGHMDVLKVRWTAQDFHVAEAYWSKWPEYSKLPDALALLDEYVPNVAKLYMPLSAMIFIDPYGAHEPRAVQWLLDMELLTDPSECLSASINAEQALTLIESYGTNIGEKEFESNGEFYWVIFIPNVPSIDYGTC